MILYSGVILGMIPYEPAAKSLKLTSFTTKLTTNLATIYYNGLIRVTRAYNPTSHVVLHILVSAVSVD